MLSATNSLNDAKARLLGMTHYGFEDETLFDAAITGFFSTAYIKYMQPALGVAAYNQISIKDKAGLTIEESAIYEAEIHFAVGEFLRDAANRVTQSREAESISKNIGGGTDSSSGMIGKKAAADEHIRDGYVMMRLGGYVYSVCMSHAGVSGEWRGSMAGVSING